MGRNKYKSRLNMIGFIKNFIKSKEEKIIGNFVFAINNIEKACEEFVKRDTYLISDSKDHFLSLVKVGRRETKIPWYFCWHSGLRSRLTNILNKFDRMGHLFSQNIPDIAGEVLLIFIGPAH